MSSPLASIQNKTPSAMGVMTRLACNRAKEEGVEVAPLLQKAGLTREQIDDHSARVDVKRQIKFLDLMAAELNDELLGFHLAQNYDLRLIGLLYYTQASSESIGEALRRAARYSSIVNEGIALRLRQGRDIAIRFEYRGVARRTDQHQIEFAMVTFVRICRQLTNRHLSATKVSFTHPRNNEAGKFNNFFGCGVTFGATDDQLCFSSSIKELPIAHADSYLNELLTGYCEQALADRETRQSPFALSVENAVTLLLPHGNAGANEIARKLGVSRRTLARRLSAEGLTFAAVVKNLKRDLAKRHLADDTLSISEIAWLLGYQDVSAFTHAFKRWPSCVEIDVLISPTLNARCGTSASIVKTSGFTEHEPREWRRTTETSFCAASTLSLDASAPMPFASYAALSLLAVATKPLMAVASSESPTTSAYPWTLFSASATRAASSRGEHTPVPQRCIAGCFSMLS